MTLQGVVNKTGIPLLLCLGAAAFAWTHPDLRGPLLLLGLIGGFVACLVGIFKPVTSPIAAPIYAVLEGLCLGAISQVIELRYHGIVVNAMLLTFGVLGLMLMLYTTRTIRVTDKLVKGVLVATAAVALVYVVDLVLNMFGTRVAYIHEAGAIGHCGNRGVQSAHRFCRYRRGRQQRLSSVHGVVLRDGSLGDAGVAVSGNPAAPLETPGQELVG